IHKNDDLDLKPEEKITTFLAGPSTYDKTSKRKQDIDKAFARMVALDVQPFYIVENRGFCDLLNIIDPKYRVPSRSKLTNVLVADLFEEKVTKLKGILEKTDSVSITTDRWSSAANDYYVTVTCHFLTDSFQFKSAVVSTSKLENAFNHNAINIAETVQNISDEWNLFDKVSAIVTDNAANVVLACKYLNKTHFPCFAHSLNLVVQDALTIEEIKEPFQKCKRIVQFFKSTTIAFAKLRESQSPEKALNLVQEVPTRWNSSFHMIRMLLLKEHVAKVLLGTPKGPKMLTADDFLILEDVSQLLTNFDSATARVSATSVAMSLLIPIICGLHTELLEPLSPLKTSEGKIVCNFLLEKIESRLSKYETLTATRISTILDPKFKMDGFRSSSNAQSAVSLIETRLVALENSGPKQLPAAPILPEGDSSPTDPLFKFLKSKNAARALNEKVDLTKSFNLYLSQSHKVQDPLEFWKVSFRLFKYL
ncbi:hypothetical protein KR084_011566, partial [Drosophila pseudotakahashii]